MVLTSKLPLIHSTNNSTNLKHQSKLNTTIQYLHKRPYKYIGSKRQYQTYYRRIPSKRRMDDELPPISSSDPYAKPKVVLFFKNGDRNFRGYHVTVTPRRFRNFENLLSELTRVTNLPQGVRYIFTPETGSRVASLDELDDGKSYVCGSYPKLKNINYGCAPDGSARKAQVNKNFIPSVSTEKLQVQNAAVPPTNIKPKIVIIIRNGYNRPRKSVKVLLNKRTAQTYDQVLNDITSAVGVDGGSGVRKLINVDGKLVMSLSELFGDDDVFIAIGNERFRPSDMASILEEFGISKKSMRNKPGSRTLAVVSPLPPPRSSPTPNKKNASKNIKKNIVPSIPTLKKLPDIKKKTETKNEDAHNKVVSGRQDNITITKLKKEEGESESVEHIVFDDLIPDIDDDMESNEENTAVDKPSLVLQQTSPLSSRKSENLPSDSIDEEVENKSKKDSVSSKDSNSHKSIKSEKSEKEINSVTIKNGSQANDVNNNINKSTSFDSNHSNSDSESSSSEVNSLSVKTVTPTHNNEKTPNELNGAKSEEAPTAPPFSPPVIENNHEQTSKSVDINKLDKIISSSDVMYEFYDIGKKLGDGNFAVVKESTEKLTKQKYAIKIIDRAKIQGKDALLRNEINIQRDCSHPNIVQLFHDFHSPTEVFLVMELVSGGDFFDLISNATKFEEEEAVLFVRDLYSGIDYLHQRNIVHRDIKPENLMVFEYPDGEQIIKLADFGLAMKVIEPIFTICGTPTYVSPEILIENGYGLEVDIWAAGVIIYIMLCGFPPFRSPNRQQTELFDLIEAGEFEFLQPYWDDISDLAKDLISKILVVDVEKRLKAKDVFSHPWLTQYNLSRNNTMEKMHKKANRFRTAARGIQSIQRMKLMLDAKMRRNESFITHVTLHHNETHS